jgi:hypothetical protein
MTTTDKIRKLLKQGKPASQIAKLLKIRPARVYTVGWLDRKKNQVMPEQSPDPAVREAERHYIKSANAAYKAKKPIKLLMQTDHLGKAQKLISERFETEYAKYKPETTRMSQEDLDFLRTKPKYRLASAQTDPVNHPPHYKAGGIETIDFIEAKDLNYRLGNVVKYVSRAGRKDSDPVQDLEKAAWYLQREIAARKNA